MRITTILAGTIATLAMSAAVAGAQAVIDPLTIGPNQVFSGLVNGSPQHGVILMNCPGAIIIGETGHPVGGQSVSVRRELPPPTAALAPFGFTGAASTISATLNLLVVTPGTATDATGSIPLAVFWLYGQQAPVPTTLTLPCYGAGTVVYDPVQGGPTARPNVVTVTFLSEPPVASS